MFHPLPVHFLLSKHLPIKGRSHAEHALHPLMNLPIPVPSVHESLPSHLQLSQTERTHYTFRPSQKPPFVL
uniref:Uncharacterized protein n=1 Tax=Anguilla anguilla TaxID=7936 RepID=A0A0E9RL86_ANGAN